MGKVEKIITESPEETQKLGEKIGSELKPGDVVALIGPLGSGKTCLTQGICQGLQVKERVTSPSFIIINEYNGRLKVYHIDLFRLKDQKELFNLGYEEYFYGDGVCIIEWAEKAKKLLPKGRIHIDLKIISESKREIYLKRL